ISGNAAFLVSDDVQSYSTATPAASPQYAGSVETKVWFDPADTGPVLALQVAGLYLRLPGTTFTVDGTGNVAFTPSGISGTFPTTTVTPPVSFATAVTLRVEMNGPLFVFYVNGTNIGSYTFDTT